MRWSAFFLGLVLVPVNQYWIASTWIGFTIMSLFINVVFITFVLAALNLGLSRVSSRLALRPSELLLVYMMLAVATGTAGHDTLEMLTQTIGYPAWFATPENDWQNLFFRYLPHWLMVADRGALEGLYTYGSTFFEPAVVRVWARPILFWSLFLIALYFLMACLNLIVRKQWVENERLAFPVAQIPLGLMRHRTHLFRERLFWIGFGGAVLLSLANGLHQLVPSFPGPTYGKFDLGALFTESPWNAIDVVYVEFLPFVLGLAFFIPVELSFSIWFFYWFWKVVGILGRMTGLHRIPGFPGYWTQGMGGMMLMAFMFLYWARHHIGEVLRAAFRSVIPNDPGEEGPYRFAAWGAIASGLFLLAFLFIAGMALWVGILFLGIYFAMSLVTTRLRAQLGPPTHELPFTASGLLASVTGVRAIDGRSLTQFAVFKFVDFGQRGSPMPQMMESLYIKGHLQTRQTAMFLAGMILSLVIGTLVGFVGNLQRGYVYTSQTWVGDWAFPQLAGQLQYRPSGVDIVYLVYFGIGAAIVLGLSVLGRVFVWWPFHPLGFIMGGEWMLRHLWFPIFLAWLIRWTVLQFAGMSGHRKATPLFLGITLGDAVMLALWSLYGTIFNQWGLSYVYW